MRTLKDYVKHEHGCAKYQSLAAVECTCGLDALLAPSPAPSTTPERLVAPDRPQGDTYDALLDSWREYDQALQDIYEACDVDATITGPADVAAIAAKLLQPASAPVSPAPQEDVIQENHDGTDGKDCQEPLNHNRLSSSHSAGTSGDRVEPEQGCHGAGNALEEVADVAGTEPRPNAEGWSLEMRYGSYRVVNGKTERTYYEQTYEGSLTQDEAEAKFRRAYAALADGNQAATQSSGHDRGSAAQKSSPAPHGVDCVVDDCRECDILGLIADWRRAGGEPGYALGYADARHESAKELEAVLAGRDPYEPEAPSPPAPQEEDKALTRAGEEQRCWSGFSDDTGVYRCMAPIGHAGPHDWQKPVQFHAGPSSPAPIFAPDGAITGQGSANYQFKYVGIVEPLAAPAPDGTTRPTRERIHKAGQYETAKVFPEGVSPGSFVGRGFVAAAREALLCLRERHHGDKITAADIDKMISEL